MGHIDQQKTNDRLITASEISHNYGQKFLVMADNETSTNERVQHEYSLDPHYSVRVNLECLYDESLFEEVHRDSVVKIFGKLSEDEEMVSGLTASSLANLILKQKLKEAPVFSFDGNTTTKFQHHFIRVFMTHGLKPVVETNQDNYQVYQMMEKSDSISSYRIPQRPVDHSTRYDHQQILILQNDDKVKNAATYLYEKHQTVSSVYVLDDHQRPKLIKGESVPLSENSRLVLVGHGARDGSTEMKISGYQSQDVSKIIQNTYRVSDKIKTVSVVACEAGSDTQFITTLMKDLHRAGIETELHLRDSLIQVRQTGEKITLEIAPDGERWKHKDDGKKVVAIIDKNEDVFIRKEPLNKDEVVFTNERNFLGPSDDYRNSWPEDPESFIDKRVFGRVDQNKVDQIKHSCYELESLSWGIFHADQPPPEKVNVNNLQNLGEHYVLAEKNGNNIKWINEEQKIKEALHDCYVVESGKDVLKIIRHYAKNGENKPTYLMVNDWIFQVDPKSLYMYPVGKKTESTEKTNVKTLIEEQNLKGKETYANMRNIILNNEKRYADFVRDVFLGEKTSNQLAREVDYGCAIYFATSVIAESARNFRTFPLILMALDAVHNSPNGQEALDFLIKKHSMAKSGSWIDSNRRGFSGAAAPQPPNINKKTSTSRDLTKLKKVTELESDMFTNWEQIAGRDNILNQMSTIAKNYKIFEDTEEMKNNYEIFKSRIKYSPSLTPFGDAGIPQTSGALGGHDDGYVTTKDLNLASELENSFKHESYYSRTTALFTKEIHDQLKMQFGEDLLGLRLKEGTARIENGQYRSQLMFDSVDAEPVEFRAELSSESQQYHEKMSKNIDTAVHEMEQHILTSNHQAKLAEHTGTAVGVLGLVLGLKGTVNAFEEGHIKDGVMGTLQTVHGATAMATSIIATKALTSETRITKAAMTIMKSPGIRGTMIAIPMAGIGFGIYNAVEDFKRHDALGYIDGTADVAMVALDVVELAVPELTPIITPINLVISVVRLVMDDVYMGIQNELSKLPKDAGVLEKVEAGFLGFERGIIRFSIRVASFFYDTHFEEIEEGQRLVAQISDYHKYYTITKQEDGMTAIDFSAGSSSWNGGGINFCLADHGQSELCMDNFVSGDESYEKKCWNIDTQGSKDIILGLGKSHQLEHKTLQKKIILFIPAGSVTVVSGYKAADYSRYGMYTGNSDSNRFFAVQGANDQDTIEDMLNYYYSLYGESGDDIFFLGPQISYVAGSGGKDIYIIPKNGGRTIINNYDSSKEVDTLHFSVDYSDISVSKSGDDVVLMYKSSHTVTLKNWFLGECYRHMNMMSADGVLFEISSTVVTSVQLVAKGINKMFKKRGQTVDASQPLLRTVRNILGTPYNDVLIGNEQNNLLEGGGGTDTLEGGEGEDVYQVKTNKLSSVLIENYSRDKKTDLAIIETNFNAFNVRVEGDNVTLTDLHGNVPISVTLVKWFRSSADRHLLFLTKDLITFTISESKNDCLWSYNSVKCLKSLSIDYSSSLSPLKVDLQEDEALNSVTEVRGSRFNDVIKGNKEHNVLVPGRGLDRIEGRGGEDWYVITPDQGLTFINNESPDLALDYLFLKEQYKNIRSHCHQQGIIIFVGIRRAIVLENWFRSKNHQHLQIKTSDGITAGLKTNRHSCGEPLMMPLTIDYRSQTPQVLQSHETHQPNCFRYASKHSVIVFCGLKGKVMRMNKIDSVKEMFGSSRFDVMVGNKNENLLDPYTGGALMAGGEGKDTYVIKRGYEGIMLIDNFAEDQKTDTVLVDMDFLDGSHVALDSSTEDLKVTILTKGEELQFSLIDYSHGDQHQHLDLLSSDGIHFKLKPLNSTEGGAQVQIEAFKVTLKESDMDCRLDLSTQRNLSKVQMVRGCPSQSNYLSGNKEGNVLVGGWKDDALDGGRGDDTLIGGLGNDILIGGMGDDNLHGGDGNDTMLGNLGNDVFIPGPGPDLVDGGSGRDTVMYRGDHERGRGVYVNLLSGEGRYADAEGDVLKDVETVIGSIYSDILVSGYESSLLKGSDGNDILVSTGGDYLVGGDGNDIYMLAFDQGSVTIDNCAKDNAMDVLYLSSQSWSLFRFQHLSDGVVLTFTVSGQSTVKVLLKGWTSDDNECGHLMLLFRDEQASVNRLSSMNELQKRFGLLQWRLGKKIIRVAK